MTEIERLQAYRASLLKAGRLLEARAVGRCIKFVKESTPQKTGRPAQVLEHPDRPPIHRSSL